MKSAVSGCSKVFSWRPQVSDRIQKLAAYVRPNGIVYDLCCDHGQIGLAAWDRLPLRSLIFVDQAPRALEALRKELEARGLAADQRIQVKACAAELLQIAEEPADFIIAGVGCRTMVNILKKLFSKGLGRHRLILCPEKNYFAVRSYLIELGYGMIAEDVVSQVGRYREIIVIEAKGGPIHLMGEGYSQQDDPLLQNFAASLRSWHQGISAKRQGSLRPQPVARPYLA